MKENTKLIFSVVVTAFFAAFIFYFNAGAFNGPTLSPPSGSGVLTVSSSSGLSIGTSTTSANTVLYIVGSTTASGNYGLKVLDAAGTSLFSVQNDGTVNVG